MDNELTNYLDFSPFYAGFEFEDESSRRTFFDEYVKLPLVLKNFMVSPEVSTQLFNFGKIKDLNDVQTTVMSSILKYVLSGHIYLKDVPGLLVHYINVDRVKAEDILASLAKQVLPPVWPDLKKIQILNFGVGRSQELDQLLQLSATSTISPSQSPISATPKPLVPPAPSSPPKIPGADLPETGGNIIDLRKQP